MSTNKDQNCGNEEQLHYHNFQPVIELKKFLTTQSNVFEKAGLTEELEQRIDQFFEKRMSNSKKPGRKYYELSLLPEMCKVMTKREWENLMNFISTQFEKSRSWFETKIGENNQGKGLCDKIEAQLKSNASELENTISNKMKKCNVTLESCEFIVDQLTEKGCLESDCLDFIYLCLQKYLDFYNLSILQHKEIAKFFDFVPRTLRYFKTMKYKSF
jgi:hypothetical protein